MKTIQKMPNIWDDQLFFTFRKTVLGELARWAIAQSPYLLPDNLSEALIEFDANFSITNDCFETSCKELQVIINETFSICPIINTWNIPKKGTHNMVFVSRYDQPAPDYDFIDLGALARNVAHAVTLQEKYTQLHN